MTTPRPNATAWTLTIIDTAGLAALTDTGNLQRFWAKVDRTGGPDVCHEWLGARDEDGYGLFHVGLGRGKEVVLRANRIAVVLMTGRPMLEGMAASPSCGNSACLNEIHLQELWPAESTAASIERGRHHFTNRPACPLQHEYDAENTFIEADGSRRCLVCRRLRDRQRGPARRAAMMIDPIKYEQLKARDRARKARARLAVAPSPQILEAS